MFYTYILQKSEHKSGMGFTLLEVLVSIGLLSILAAGGWWVGLDTYYGFLLHNERDQVLTLLHRARSGSQHRTYGEGMRVCRSTDKYILVFGNDCYSQAKVVGEVERNLSLDVSWPGDLSFMPISGRANGGVILFAVRGRNLTININNEGRID